MNVSRNCNDGKSRRGLLNPLFCVLPALLSGSVQAAGSGQPLSDPVLSTGLVQMVSGLLLIIVVIFTITWVIKRVPGLQSVSQGTIRIVDALHVSTRERVVLVQVGEQQVLLGVTSQNINTLYVLPEPLSRGTGQSEMASRLVNLFHSRKDGVTQ